MYIHSNHCLRKVSSPDAAFRGKSMRREVSEDLTPNNLLVIEGTAES